MLANVHPGRDVRTGSTTRTRSALLCSSSQAATTTSCPRRSNSRTPSTTRRQDTITELKEFEGPHLLPSKQGWARGRPTTRPWAPSTTDRPRRSGVRITHIGGPTTLIEVNGWRILTDPTFDPPGRRYTFGWGSASRKVSGPAIDGRAEGTRTGRGWRTSPVPRTEFLYPQGPPPPVLALSGSSAICWSRLRRLRNSVRTRTSRSARRARTCAARQGRRCRLATTRRRRAHTWRCEGASRCRGVNESTRSCRARPSPVSRQQSDHLGLALADVT